MAEEKRRDGGRNEPLISDEWRPGHARRGIKRFGVKLTYQSLFRGRTIEYCQWYRTARARDIAFQHESLPHPVWWRDRIVAKVER